MPDDPNPHAQEFQLAEARMDPTVVRLYCNAFVNAFSPVDVTVLLKVNSLPTALISMPIPLAKDLITHLSNGISQVEEAFGQKILSGMEGHERLKASQEAKTKRDSNPQVE